MNTLKNENPGDDPTKSAKDITKAEVEGAIAEAGRRGLGTSPNSLRKILGRGSFSTIQKYRDEIVTFDPTTEPIVKEAIRLLGDRLGSVQSQNLSQQLVEAMAEIRRLEGSNDVFEKQIDELNGRLQETEHARNEVSIKLTAALDTAKGDRDAVDQLKAKIVDCMESERRNAVEHATEQKNLRRQVADLEAKLRNIGAKSGQSDLRL